LHVKLKLVCVNTHSLHLLDELLGDSVGHCHIDLLHLAFSQNTFRVFELRDRTSCCVVATGDAYNLQQWVEDVLAEASMGLPVVHEHLLKYLFGCDAPKAARLGPGLIDYTVACHPVGR